MALIHFTVEGTGPFPFDMLRYDVCWPLRQEDTAAMERLFRPSSKGGRPVRGPVRITLATNGHPPTVARWKSFGWKVID